MKRVRGYKSGDGSHIYEPSPPVFRTGIHFSPRSPLERTALNSGQLSHCRQIRSCRLRLPEGRPGYVAKEPGSSLAACFPPPCLKVPYTETRLTPCFAVCACGNHHRTSPDAVFISAPLRQRVRGVASNCSSIGATSFSCFYYIIPVFK